MDALRGIAALLVVVMHIQHVTAAGGLFARAYLAVDLFFALSGYVIARTYEAKLSSGMSAVRFGEIRARRLWPTMFAGALLGAAAYWNDFAPAEALLVLAMAALFIPFLRYDAPCFPQNPPTWSILFELFANAFHALLLRRLGCRSLAAVAGACAALLVVYAPSFDVGSEPAHFWLGVPRVLFSYAVGILIWRMRGDRPLLPAWLGLLALPTFVVLAGAAGSEARWPDFLFVLLLCPAIVLSGLSTPRLGRRGLAFLGGISFPLYAVHYPVVFMGARAGLGLAALLPLALVAAWVVSLLVDRRLPRFVSGKPVPA